MAIEIFNRYENKYLLDTETFCKVRKVINEHMNADAYNKNGECYTIANIYYDTPDDHLVRNSLSKPVYKEKLRLRAYGVPDFDTVVFLEIKKKFKGLVNKRRTPIKLCEAYEFLKDGKCDDIKPYMNGQVTKELNCFMSRYNLMPKVYIAYDRLAYFEKDNNDLRISFDTNIRTRRHDLGLERGDYGKHLLDEDTWLMEIKTSSAMPMWLVYMLDELEIKRRSFSKYGTEFKQTVNRMKENNIDVYFTGVDTVFAQRANRI